MKKFWFLIGFLAFWEPIDAQTKLTTTTNHHVATTAKPLPPDELHHLGNHVFELSNTHKSGASLKFSIRGPNITGSPFHETESIWRMTLSDGSNFFMGSSKGGKSPSDHTEYYIVWSSEGDSPDRELCFHYGHANASWYSAYEEKAQHWPMDTSQNFPQPKPFITADFFSGDFGSVIEYLFVNSDGFAVILSDFDAWFLRRSSNNGDPLLCVSIDGNKFPYQRRASPHLSNMVLRVVAARNVREVHQAIMKGSLISRPTKIPDETMFTKPIWSTWAQYKAQINQSNVLEFAQEIKKHDFPVSQIEIDDLWEVKYGDFTFDTAKFANISKLVEDIHSLGYRATLWAYPFVNFDSAAFNESRPYLARNVNGGLAGVTWWNGLGGIVDFSNLDAIDWFVARLKKLQAETKIDSFKFDAGELSWYGKEFNFTDEASREYPNLVTLRYVLACAQFGNMVEVRSAFRTQEHPIFVRMLDKNSNWSIDNGLKSLITTALTFSLAGYSFILPDMIGGNAYDSKPSEELYLRWVQANVFLPSMQFSIPPWVYSQSTVNLTRKFVNLHVEHSPTLIALAKKVPSGEPIIRPMWYAAPEDSRSFTIADQFMVGEDILVAPVVEEGQRERNVFFPAGKWLDPHGKLFSGPVVAKVAAPLDELPYFKRKHN